MMTAMKMKLVFWFAASFVGYSYLGYPAWLWLRSRWSPRPVRRSSSDAAGFCRDGGAQ
jgi:hypothetical protein